ncbi:MAG: hypothetical protein IH607_04840 [Firmicutes bacterium]|nr:hypothetical protein [Bacillota bacterium]
MIFCLAKQQQNEDHTVREKLVAEAKQEFWNRVHSLVKQKYELAPVFAVEKLKAAYKAMVFEDISVEKANDMLITRLPVHTIDDQLMQYKYHSGFFFEGDIRTLDEILPVCDQRCQTLTYYGLSNDDIRAFISQSRPLGIDRAVPIGKSMDFSLIWDGYDLIRMMSRRISVI